MGATNRRPFYSRRPRAQPIGGNFIFGGQARNLLRNQSEEGLFSKAGRATKGATNRRGRFIFGGRRRRRRRRQIRRRRRQPPLRRNPKRPRAHRRGPDWLDTKMRAGLRPIYARRLGWWRGPSGELSCDFGGRGRDLWAQPNARGATPDLCSPFGLEVGPKRRSVL